MICRQRSMSGKIWSRLDGIAVGIYGKPCCHLIIERTMHCRLTFFSFLFGQWAQSA
jgi:hypothetical protein